MKNDENGFVFVCIRSLKAELYWMNNEAGSYTDDGNNTAPVPENHI